MEKKTLNKLDLDLYEEVLDNGFRIFVIPFPNVNNMYVTLSTNYGSIQREFIPYGETEMVEVPDGVAHFLEHKVFEQKDGKDPFEFFGERGADANANTTNVKTTYLFSGSKYLEDNLNYLLDYVYSPYFTDENVEKEKGIIEQEMRMYEDDPYSVIFENMTYNTFVNHPIKIRVIGNYDSIYSITKEDLYTCYNTFYQPSNMFLVATGNVKPKEIIDIVKKNMSKKKFGKTQKIEIKKYDEPNKVAKKNDSIAMNVNVPKVGIGYKLDISKFNLPFKDIYNYISLFFDIKCGSTSLLNEELKNKGIINEELYISSVDVDNYICFYVLAETKNTKKLLDSINEVIQDKKVDKKDFDRKVNATISSLISASDNIYAMNSKVMNNIIRYNKVETNDYDKIRNLSFDEMKKVINKLDFSNYLTYIVKPK
ncbi:MAG: insulinase family protein [Bacilli bacterium]|nr:insulinase family protein [Bacilli bacterium]